MKPTDGTQKGIRRERFDRSSRDSLDQLQAAFDAISDAVSVIDFNGVILQSNQAMARLVGRTVKETVGRRCWELVHDRSDPIEGCPVGRMRESHRKETMLLPVNGRIWHVSVYPIRNAHREPTAAVHIISDVTEQKKREEEVYQTRKLESIQTLAGGLAHEFNNVMMIIWGNVDLAAVHAASDARVVKCLKHAGLACERAKQLSRQLLTFSRGGSLTKQRTAIAGLVRDAASRALQNTEVRSELDLPADLWEAHADREQISQVLCNLIDNAAASMCGKGTLWIAAKNLLLESASRPPLKPGRYIHVTVADHGIGISKEYLARIFDPYFTTKANGTGLGLSLAHSILHKHGGTISVASTPGAGSTFTFWLPAIFRKGAAES